MDRDDFVVEIAEFRLAGGVNEKAFLKASDVVQEKFLSRQDGFIGRELLGRDGLFMDIVHWKSLPEAQKAAELMLKDQDCLEFISGIDPTSIKMMHLPHKRIYAQ